MPDRNDRGCSDSLAEVIENALNAVMKSCSGHGVQNDFGCIVPSCFQQGIRRSDIFNLATE